MFLWCRFTMTANGSGIGEVGAFKEQMFNSAQMLIDAQCSNLALLPHYCQYDVVRSLFSMH
jgi:hypothetical protein